MAVWIMGWKGMKKEGRLEVQLGIPCSKSLWVIIVWEILNATLQTFRKSGWQIPCPSNLHLFLYPVMAEALGLALRLMFSALACTSIDSLFRLVVSVTKGHEVLIISEKAASKSLAGTGRIQCQCDCSLAVGEK